MTDWIKKALTKTKQQHNQLTITEPDTKLVYDLEFAIATTTSLGALGISHPLILKTWKSEILSLITGFASTITDIFITKDVNNHDRTTKQTQQSPLITHYGAWSGTYRFKYWGNAGASCRCSKRQTET